MLLALEGINPFELENVKVNDGHNHPLDKKNERNRRLFFKSKKDYLKFLSKEKILTKSISR